MNNMHDQRKCPNCENCITDLRKENTRLREDMAKFCERLASMHGIIDAAVEFMADFPLVDNPKWQEFNTHQQNLEAIAEDLKAISSVSHPAKNETQAE